MCRIILVGERFGFQVAFRAIGYGMFDISYELKGVNLENAEVFLVREVPCTYPVAACSDDYVLTADSCVMPDLLTPISKVGIAARDGDWQALYVRLHDLPAGRHEMTFSLLDGKKELLGCVNYTLEVLPKVLPESDLTCSYWIHYDSIAEYYRLSLFSDEYNVFMKAFICDAVEHGLTTLLTPLFTSPLDTEIGKERMTVQLIGVEKTKNGYRFDFNRLGWFMQVALDCGVKYFELSHLFTQWGAKCVPKIVATVNGEEKKIFGWETEALSGEYSSFLKAFLPALRAWLIENGKLNLDNCANGVELAIIGTSLSVKLTSTVDNSYMRVYVDNDREGERIKISKGTNTYTVAENLRVFYCARTECRLLDRCNERYLRKSVSLGKEYEYVNVIYVRV